jgi:hypothetical protein
MKALTGSVGDLPQEFWQVTASGSPPSSSSSTLRMKRMRRRRRRPYLT